MRLRELFALAAELPAAQRTAFCVAQCPHDQDLREELLALLALADHDDSFLQGSVADLAAGLVAPHDPMPSIAGYDLLERIGEGGMGTVYLAEQTQPVRRLVAIKVARLGLDTRQVLTRFERERAVLARMSHDNVARVFAAGATTEGRPWFAMEYVAGTPIHRFCDERGLNVTARIRLFLQVCAGVQHAHQKGVIHRDLKPSNVLVTCVDDVPLAKVLDFGLARAIRAGADGAERTQCTLEGMVLGTPDYMSPEQAAGDPTAVDARTDIYGLGVVLYELLTGARPHPAAAIARVGTLGLQRLLAEQAPPRPSARIHERLGAGAAQLDWVVLRALAVDPAARHQSPAELAAELRQYLAGEPIARSHLLWWHRLRLFVRRNRRVVAAAAMVAVLVISGLVGSVLNLIDTTAATARARAVQTADERVMDPLVVRDLLDRARAPWPAESTCDANLAAIAEWLVQADLVLERAGTHRAAAASEGLRPETRQRLVAMLDETTALRAIRLEVAARPAILARHWPLWEQARRSLAGVAGFEGTDLRPLPNLIPLGIDRDKNLELGRQVEPLWLFAVGGTGELPQWVDATGQAAEYGTPGRAVLGERHALLMVLVPGGTFWRGAQTDDPQGRNFDTVPRRPGEPNSLAVPVQQVHVPPFLIAKHEVTRAQYAACAAARRQPDRGPVASVAELRLAAGGVDWRDASMYCVWAGLVLPSETRWEYAARAGTSSGFWAGADVAALARVGWFDANQAMGRQPVGRSPSGTGAPNPWGLHDVHGGVREWCADEVSKNWDAGPADDSTRHTGLFHRVVRGGSYSCPPSHCLSGYRCGYPPGCHYPNMGFRPALALPGPGR